MLIACPERIEGLIEKKMAKIIPGILTNDEGEYEKRLRTAEHVSDLIQIDVIDGKFANNITVGPDVIMKYPSSSSLEVQLMVLDALDYIEKLKDANYVSRIIFPFESESDLSEAIYAVKNCGKQAGLSINPQTKVRDVFGYFKKLDLLSIYAGDPGFSGQNFDERTLGRIKEAKELDPTLAIEVDIGVNFETAPKIAGAGADFLVATSVLLNADDYYLAYQKLAQLASSR